MILAAAPLAAAQWHSTGDPTTEPDTLYDLNGGYMWQTNWMGPGERVYFNVFLSPTATGGNQGAGRFWAILGAWKDCNGDTYVGDGLLGQETYSSFLLPPGNPCQAPSPHNVGGIVRELLWIGPGSSHIDGDPLVWLDWGRPDTVPSAGPKISTEVTFVYDDAAAGARWSSPGLVHAPPNGVSSWATAYAFVDPGTLAANGLSVPGTMGAYGAEACNSHVGVIQNGWSCDPATWPGTVKVGQRYQLRDIDCMQVTTSIPC